MQPNEDTLDFQLTCLPELEALADLWKALDESGDHSFFSSWIWIGSWLRSCGSNGQMHLLKATVRGQLRGMAVLVIKDCKYRGLFPVRRAWLNATGDQLADRIAIEHNGFATGPVSIDPISDHLSKWLLEGRSGIDEIVLPGVSVLNRISVAGTALVEHGSSTGFRVPLYLNKSHAVGAYLSPNSRQQLRKAVRIVERTGPISLKAAASLEEAIAYLESMKQLHIDYWTKRNRKNAFSNSLFEPFCREMISAGFHSESLDLIQVSTGKYVLGYLFNLKRRGIVYNYQSGFNYALAGARPGYVCHDMAIKYYLAQGYRYYDFLGGDNQLKRSFGTERYELIWQSVRRPKLIYLAENFVRQLYRKGLHLSQ